MNLGDLISLLVVVLFVASAFLGRRDRGGRRRAPPQGPRPGEVREEREAPADGRTPASSTEASSPNQGSEESPLQRRLEEARRKVREAASGEGSATTVSRRPSAERGGSLADGETSVGGPVHPRPGGTGSGGGAPSGRPSTSPAPSPFGPPPDRPRPQTDRPRPTIGQGPRAHAAQTRSEGSSSQRKRRPSSAKLSAAELLAFEREDIVRGFVWSVIYSDPVSMRAMRRKVSPRRLP